jgi:hypothetical protein
VSASLLVKKTDARWNWAEVQRMRDLNRIGGWDDGSPWGRVDGLERAFS